MQPIATDDHTGLADLFARSPGRIEKGRPMTSARTVHHATLAAITRIAQERGAQIVCADQDRVVVERDGSIFRAYRGSDGGWVWTRSGEDYTRSGGKLYRSAPDALRASLSGRRSRGDRMDAAL